MLRYTLVLAAGLWAAGTSSAGTWADGLFEELSKDFGCVLMVSEAVLAGAGVDAAGVDAAARSVIEEAGMGERFAHGLGHGVGLEIHEDPFLHRSSQEVLPAGAVVTIEPGVYVPGLGGVRIEDMVEVREDGRRALPRSSKELIVT